MFEVGVYLIVAYALLVTLRHPFIWVFRRLAKAVGKAHSWGSRRGIALALVAYFALPFLPYIIVETQTAVFGKQAEAILGPQLAADGDDPHIRLLKVLLVGYHYRHVYAVSPCTGLTLSESGGCSQQATRSEPYPCGGPMANGFAGWTYDLRYTAHGWTGGNQNDGEVVWSDCSPDADDNIFPPYAAAGVFR